MNVGLRKSHMVPLDPIFWVQYPNRRRRCRRRRRRFIIALLT